MKKVFTVLLLALALVVTSCTTFKVGGLAYGVSDNVTVVGTFEKTITVWKFLGTSGGETFANISQDATDDAIQNAIRNEVQALGGNAAINVKIEQKASFLNMLVNGITGSLVAPVDVIISGTVVKL